ncbi:MAG: hypothetical protein HYV26_06655 [Candidatus Hydrogenedentes bacterium]|nr:hypothetical protein [Candidatus Hydrogenedentota bacterium]
MALGLLAKRVGKAQGAQTQRRWTQVLAVSFVLFLLLYVNIYKNVAVWVNEGKTVPVEMRVPLLPVIPTESGELFKFPAAAWFNSVWIALTIAGIYLMVRHLRRPVALLPESWLGRGQLLYLVFLWAMVVANFERALTGFAEQRLITEWVILINAVIVTVLILARPAPEGIEISGTGETRYAGRLVSTILLGLLSAAAVLVIMTGIVRGLYGDTFAGHSGQMVRFGPNAEWRIHPIVKGGEHR